MTTTASIAPPASRRNLSALELQSAVIGTQYHAGRDRPWRHNDTATMAEFARRAWNWARVEGLKLIGVPRAVENLLVSRSPTGRRISRAIWRPLVGAVCAAYRAGTTGVRLSMEQVAVLIGASRSTASRAVRDLAAAGLIVRQHTYTGTAGEIGTRLLDTTIYQVGPKLLAHVRGGLETGDRGARYAAAARARARKERRARYICLWEAQRGSHTPESGRSPAVAHPPAADPPRGGVKVGTTPLKLGGITLPDPPGSGEAKDRSASVAAPPLPAWLPPAEKTAKPAATGGSGRRRGLAREGLQTAGQSLAALARAARAVYFGGGE